MRVAPILLGLAILAGPALAQTGAQTSAKLQIIRWIGKHQIH